MVVQIAASHMYEYAVSRAVCEMGGDHLLFPAMRRCAGSVALAFRSVGCIRTAMATCGCWYQAASSPDSCLLHSAPTAFRARDGVGVHACMRVGGPPCRRTSPSCKHARARAVMPRGADATSQAPSPRLPCHALQPHCHGGRRGRTACTRRQQRQAAARRLTSHHGRPGAASSAISFPSLTHPPTPPPPRILRTALSPADGEGQR
jgi:hypothetical protein